MAAQLVASREVLSSTELVSYTLSSELSVLMANNGIRGSGFSNSVQAWCCAEAASVPCYRCGAVKRQPQFLATGVEMCRGNLSSLLQV
jgi:hypothetical protein